MLGFFVGCSCVRSASLTGVSTHIERRSRQLHVTGKRFPHAASHFRHDLLVNHSSHIFQLLSSSRFFQEDLCGQMHMPGPSYLEPTLQDTRPCRVAVSSARSMCSADGADSGHTSARTVSHALKPKAFLLSKQRRPAARGELSNQLFLTCLSPQEDDGRHCVFAQVSVPPEAFQ